MSESLKFVNAMGEEILLHDPGHIEYLYGRTGAFAPPFSIVSDPVAGRDGGEFRASFAEAAEIDIPVQVLGTNAADLWSKLRNLRRILNPKLGMGRLIVTTPDGVESEIECVVSEINMSEDDNATFTHDNAPSIQQVLIVFTAPDPFWQSTSISTYTFTQGQPAMFFPFFPLRLSASQVFSEQVINNPGDVEAYPEWVITGPGDSITLRNQTTGKILQLDPSVSLGSGEQIVIDTKRRTIKKNDGTNLFPYLVFGTELWTLRRGLNTITVEMGNTNTNSSVQLSIRPRYLGV